MAASDYTRRGGGNFCTMAVLQQPLGRFDGTATVGSLTYDGEADNRSNGMLAMIGDELIRVDTINGATLSISRGVADTLPLVHAAGAPVWFFDTDVGADTIEHLGVGTMAVKVLPRTLAHQMPIEAAPPHNLSLNMRFIRPYPPAGVRVNGQRWVDANPTLSTSNTSMTITWANRNRVLQSDQLLGHDEPGVLIESGTTYRIELVDENGVVKDTVDTITGQSLEYTIENAVAHFDFPYAGVHAVTMRLWSLRDGYTSLYPYEIHFNVNNVGASVYDRGWGRTWNYGWNG